MVSENQWKNDISNTIKEIEAYEILEKGYSILSTLPENSNQPQYRLNARKYSALANECTEFLQQLFSCGAAHEFEYDSE